MNRLFVGLVCACNIFITTAIEARVSRACRRATYTAADVSMPLMVIENNTANNVIVEIHRLLSPACSAELPAHAAYVYAVPNIRLKEVRVYDENQNLLAIRAAADLVPAQGNPIGIAINKNAKFINAVPVIRAIPLPSFDTLVAGTLQGVKSLTKAQASKQGYYLTPHHLKELADNKERGKSFLKDFLLRPQNSILMGEAQELHIKPPSYIVP